ncbi:MAG TPA: hypothetical protein ENK28_14810 [Aliiroseovarius sp.]|nr:hypothetical protein [Aliiroseovarius sp.]
MMKTRDMLIAAACVVALASAAMATDFTKLRNDQRVHNELLVASLIYLITDNCSDLKVRKLRLVGRVLSLQKYARGLGYTNSEISDYIDSKEEQDRFRAIAEPMLAKMGAVKGDANSYCAVGRAEIEKGSEIGAALR